VTDDNRRLEQFRAEIATLRLKETNPAHDAQRLLIGGFLLTVGVVVGIVAFGPQEDAIVIALIGVTLSLAGLALYLRYGLIMFMRFWLARMIFEQQQRG
jgi:hypothetical protein